MTLCSFLLPLLMTLKKLVWLPLLMILKMLVQFLNDPQTAGTVFLMALKLLVRFFGAIF